ncbi:MAG: hypothetical protein IKF39_11135 [Oscillospiraceae bacterium]|nr:hypothetical protein [Oscillospiraceae bacterium]
MSDLISRQEALIAIMDLYPGMPRVPWLRKKWARRYEPYIDAENAIRRLPSAEPEPCKDVQYILDYLDEVLHPIVSSEHWNVYSELHDMISTLSSVHPDYDCVLKQFGDCTYDTTGCSGCVIKAKIKAALSVQPERNCEGCRFTFYAKSEEDDLK